MSYARELARSCWLSWQFPKTPEQKTEAKLLETRIRYYRDQHKKRFERLVTNRKPRLTCQECGGTGSITEASIDFGDDFSGSIMFHVYGPCGWCEETGYVTPHIRGIWLRSAKETKRLRMLRRH